MSKSLNQELRSWKDLESQIGGMRTTRNGVPLSKRDNCTYCTGVFLQACVLRDLLSSSSPDRSSRIIRWCKTIVTFDVLQVSDCFKKILSFMRNYESLDLSYSAFKQHFKSDFPFIGDFLSPIKEEVEDYLSSPSATTFTIINQFCSFLSRISLQDIDLDVESLQRYLATEKRLADSTYPEPTLRVLNRIMREWFSTYHDEVLVPSHGNGSVADVPRRPSILDKYLVMKRDTRLDYWLSSYGDISSFSPRWSDERLQRTCRVQCVAKSISTKRVISMEPTVLQYFQHAVFRNIDHHISEHPVLKKRIHIHNSSYNYDLARIGSTDQSYATIDLSDASDSVSWSLVKALFTKTPLLRALYCTRSDKALLPDEEVIVLHKFAPMGSALCFPIECLVFAAICEYVLRFSGIHYPQGIIPYVVYGDDIVIRTELADHVIEILHDLNFVVNQEKTFTKRTLAFRESCGGEFFSGINVTPVRLSRKFSDLRPCTMHPEMVPHYIKMANNLLDYKFRIARLWFVRNLLSLPVSLLPEFGENESQINSPGYSNYRHIHKYSRNWQCDLILCGNISVTYKPDSLDDEDIRYFEWLRASSLRTGDHLGPVDLFDIHLSRPRLKLKSRFVSNS